MGEDSGLAVGHSGPGETNGVNQQPTAADQGNRQPVTLPNSPRLALIPNDALFHLGIDLNDAATVSKFTNVKFVCMGGTASRMRNLALALKRSLQKPEGEINGRLTDDVTSDSVFEFSFSNDRYSGYKTGPVFCVNHGIGTPSLSIVLHEVCKLLYRAKCTDVTMVRIGTCGGVGLPSGTVVVSDAALTPGLQPVFTTSSLGQPLQLPIVVDQALVDDVIRCHSDQDDFDVVRGATYCADDFYQGQGRLDGALCDYSQTDQKAFFQKLHELGVRNIEMESAGLLAFAHRVGIKAVVVCVTLVDRLKADLPDAPDHVVTRPLTLVTRLIRRRLGMDH